jgi:hypothetical protein
MFCLPCHKEKLASFKPLGPLNAHLAPFSELLFPYLTTTTQEGTGFKTHHVLGWLGMGKWNLPVVSYL